MEPLKNEVSREFLVSLSKSIKKFSPSFDEKKFISKTYHKDYAALSMKERINHVAASLNEHIPGDFNKKAEIVVSVASLHKGLPGLIFPAFFEHFGLGHFESSVRGLKEVTKFSTSEFGVRPFIVKYGKRMMAEMKKWAVSEDEHLRRLASEGCRPRLPWGMKLVQFTKDPSLVMEILEILKNDDSIYVRKSVANNLNDISKDNPGLLLETIKKWKGKSSKTDWILKKACRTLLKNGNPSAMKLFGIHKAKIRFSSFKVEPKVKMGEKLKFSFEITPAGSSLLKVAYCLDFKRSRNKTNGKIFHISEQNYPAGKKIVFNRSYSFHSITTRKYYPGEHFLSIIVNGEELGKKKFLLM